MCVYKRLTNDRFFLSFYFFSKFFCAGLAQFSLLVIYRKEKHTGVVVYIRWIGGVHFVSCCFPTEMSPTAPDTIPLFIFFFFFIQEKEEETGGGGDTLSTATRIYI